MARFQYTVRTLAGESAQGEVSAPTESDAVRMLRAEGKFVVALRELGAQIEQMSEPLSVRKRRVSKLDVIHFTGQMAIMMETGVSITDAIHGILDDTPPGAFHAVLTDLLEQLEAGSTLSAALSRHPGAFGCLYVNLVRASEASGRLGEMLQRCADFMTNERDTRKAVRRAMIYPMVLLLMSIGVTIFLMTYLMPKFAVIYAGREAVLPMPTRILFAVSEWLTGWWYIWAPTIAGVVGGAWVYLRSTRGRPAAAWIRMHLPVLGPLYKLAIVTRSLRTMGTLVDSGVSMLDSVEITRNVVQNHYFERMWDQATERLHRGEQLSAPLGASPLMPRHVVQMITAGEQSGRLGEVMSRVGLYLEDELRLTIKAATNLIEPAMIFFMGLLIGGIAIALLLPIFTISRVMTQ